MKCKQTKQVGRCDTIGFSIGLLLIHTPLPEKGGGWLVMCDVGHCLGKHRVQPGYIIIRVQPQTETGERLLVGFSTALKVANRHPFHRTGMLRVRERQLNTQSTATKTIT